jgi:glycosyltransferase involved in cell wall biosynthesis
MRIAQVSPLLESVPPQLYGGTERIVSYLTEELVRQGHEVTLYASGDSLTSARLRPMCDRALRLGDSLADPVAHHMLLLEHVMREAHNFDIVHFHLDYLPFPLIRRNGIPSLTTLHGRLDASGVPSLFREYSDMHLVSISDAQREPMPWAGWAATVHHGIPEDLYKQGDGDGGYLAFLGRISQEKRLDRAIEIARQVGMPLRVAAKIDGADQTYFEENIRDLLGDANVDFIGEIGENEKNEFLGNARALLFPIDWPEPFGLVMIEAMACGTPVIAFRGGSVEEIIEDGVTGFVVSDIEEAVKAVLNLDAIIRSVCRARFEQRFSVSRMGCEYVNVYRRILDPEAASIRGNGHLKHHLRGALLSDELTITKRE